MTYDLPDSVICLEGCLPTGIVMKPNIKVCESIHHKNMLLPTTYRLYPQRIVIPQTYNRDIHSRNPMKFRKTLTEPSCVVTVRGKTINYNIKLGDAII